MATVKRKAAKQSARAKKAAKSAGSTAQKSVKSFLHEAEKTSDALLHQVKNQFETLTRRISSAAGNAAKTAASVTETHVGAEIAEFVSSTMSHRRDHFRGIRSLAQAGEDLHRAGRESGWTQEIQGNQEEGSKEESGEKNNDQKEDGWPLRTGRRGVCRAGQGVL